MLAGAAVALDLSGPLAVPVGTATWLLALGGVLTALVPVLLGRSAVPTYSNSSP